MAKQIARNKARADHDREGAGRLALDREFLERVKAHGKPVTVPELFMGFTPVWAASAGERVADEGRATRDRDGRYAVTAAGLAWLKTNAGK